MFVSIDLSKKKKRSTKQTLKINLHTQEDIANIKSLESMSQSKRNVAGEKQQTMVASTHSRV